MAETAAWKAIVAIAKWLATSKSFAAFVARIVVMTAASAGLGRLMARKGNLGLTSSSPLDLRMDPLAPHRVIYGEREVGGVMRFRHTAGTNNKYLYLVYIWAATECEAITEFKADGNVVGFDGSGNALGTFAGFLRVTHHLGAHNQTADANFVAELGGSGVFTSTDRFQGRCYSAIRLEYSQEKFPSGIPQFTAKVKGKKVYDWRDEDQDIDDYSTWKWSDNPPVCIADFLRGCPVLNGAGELIRPYGMDATEDQIPPARWIPEANACDESVPLAGGGSEKRYTLNGCFDVDTQPPVVLDAMAAAMAGKIVPTGAEFIPFAGVYHAPDFTLDETMLRGEPSASNPLPRPERVNVLKGTYIDPATGQPDDFNPVVLTGFIDEDGGELAKDIALDFTNSRTMARRIAKIGALRTRQGIVTQWPCNLRALPAMAGENVAINSTEFDWSAKAFEVTEFTLSMQRGNDGGVGFVPDLVMQETDPSIFDWETSEEGTDDPAPNTASIYPRSVPVPASITLSTVPNYQPGGLVVPRMRVIVPSPASVFVTSGGKWIIEYKKAADSTWLEWTANEGDKVEDFITDVVANETYHVRSRWRNVFGVPGAWSSTYSHTVANFTSVPSAPSAATKTGEGIRLGADGTAWAYFEFSVPALPTGAIRQVLKYRVNTSGEYLATGPLYNISAATVRIEGLIPGQSYQVVGQAESLTAPSSLTSATGTPFTAPSVGPTPAAPTGLSISTTAAALAKAPPRYISGGGAKMACMRVTWTASTSKDVAFYRITADPTVLPGAEDDTLTRTAGTETEKLLYFGIASGPVYVGVYAISTTGAVSAGLLGVATPTTSYGTGDMAEQAKNSVAVTGISTGSGVSVRKVVARFMTGSVNLTLTGGAPSQTFDVSLTGRGFSTKPDFGQAHITSGNDAWLIRYDFNSASSTSSNARMVVYTAAGSNLPAGLTAYTALFEEYD